MNFRLPEYFLGDLTATLTFGLLAILLVIAGYKIFDIVLTRLDFDEEIKKGNLAMGIVIGSFILGLCYVIAHVVTTITSG
jgi:putative membrane protein